MSWTKTASRVFAALLISHQRLAAATNAKVRCPTFAFREQRANLTCSAGKRSALRQCCSAVRSQERSLRPVTQPTFLQFRCRTRHKPAPEPVKPALPLVGKFVIAACIAGFMILTITANKVYWWHQNQTKGVEPLPEPMYGLEKKVLSQCQGFSLPADLTDTIVHAVPKFECRPDDVWVISFPKAGTTWVQELVYLICTDFNFKAAKAENIEARFPHLEHGCPGIREIAQRPSPRFIKTHIPFSLLPPDIEEKKPKIIYVARNPKDTVVSLWAFNELKGFDEFPGMLEDFAELFLLGNVIYGPWWKHVAEAWSHRDDENVLFIKYEDLKSDFHGTVKGMAEFLDKELTDEQIVALKKHCSFKSMQQNNSVNYTWYKGTWRWKEGHFMRKGAVGDWKNYLPAEKVEEFDCMTKWLGCVEGLQFVDTLPEDK